MTNRVSANRSLYNNYPECFYRCKIKISMKVITRERNTNQAKTILNKQTQTN